MEQGRLPRPRSAPGCLPGPSEGLGARLRTLEHRLGGLLAGSPWPQERASGRRPNVKTFFSAVAAQEEETRQLDKRRKEVDRQLQNTRQRMVELEETREQRRLDAVRRGLSKARIVEQSQHELEGLIDLAAARTMVRLQGGDGRDVQEENRLKMLDEKNALLREKAEERARCKKARPPCDPPLISP